MSRPPRYSKVRKPVKATPALANNSQNTDLEAGREPFTIPASMAELSPNLPRAEAGDAAEVVLALQTARTLWSQGQGLESVRWIQRAAENAGSAGSDLRAVSLARAAADLRAEVGVASEPPGALNEAVALAPYDDFTEQTIVDSLSSSVLVPLPGGAPVADAVVSPTAEAVSDPMQSQPATLKGRVLSHQAVRVAVLGGDRSTRVLSVRVLAEGEVAPPGSGEALLVALDAQLTFLP